LALIDGWQVVVKKGDFEVDEKVIYFEIDSFLPIKPEYEFLRKSCYYNTSWLGEGFRIKTIRLRKQISQGLISKLENQELELYSDLTEELGVQLYEQPVPTNIGGEIKGSFPHFIPKTDQERIQNIWCQIADYDDTFEVSIKLDGTSITLYKFDGVFGICSRNWELKINEENIKNNSLVKTGLKYQNLVPDNHAIQGELVGPGIQGNPYRLKEVELFIFDVFDIEKQIYLKSEDRLKYINFPHVPVVGYKNINNCNFYELLDYAGKYKSLNDTISEGVVFKSITNPNNHFKIINNQYLLKDKN